MIEVDTRLWWKAPKGQVHSAVSVAVRRMEEAQGELFDRFVKLEVLYDPNTPLTHQDEDSTANVSENTIASNIDSLAASISTTDVRARVQTDGADWKTQRRARHLEWYAEEQKIKLGVMPRCRSAFKEGSKKGNGLTKTSTRFGKPIVEHVLVDNIVVDPNECRDGRDPRQMHEWVTTDADELCARFPKYEEQIERARTSGWRNGWRKSAREFLTANNDVTYLESFRLPIGEQGMPGYRPGRHTITIDGCDLLDEKWEDELFPYAVIVYTERTTSWYGISGAERIAGIQRALNKRNWQIERQLEYGALPTTYVRPADANLTVKSSRVGAVAVVKGDYPHTVAPVAVSPETYQSRLQLRDAASEEFGQSRLATHAAKPAGLDSAVALREYRDQSSQRFALQEAAFEQLVLDTIWLVLWACKKLGAKAPMMMRHSRFGTRRIRWSDVDMGDMRVQLAAASNLNRTPAGRMQMVMEFAQAGIISPDAVKRLINHPDLESEMSLYNAALESVEHALDAIADDSAVMPEPFMNLKMCVWRGQQEYLKWQNDGAPEETLEMLRQFVVQAAWMDAARTAPAANQNIAPDAVAGGAGDPNAMPPMPTTEPVGGQPTAALAAQAMQLRAS
jgi:hypothetical protein